MSDVSTLFELLTADTRRRLLVTLCDVDSVHVPSWLFTRGAVQRTSSGQQPHQKQSADESTSRELQLYHNHLPKLEAEDVIEWDRETETVSRGPTFEEIEPAIRLLATNQHTLPGDFY